MDLFSFISNLRIIGLLAGLAMLVFSFFRLRRHAENRTDVLAYSVCGVLLLCVSIYPPIVQIPSELISLSTHNNGRIITLLLISVFFLSLFWIDERSKRKLMDLQLDKLIRNLAIDNFLSGYRSNIPSPSVVVIMPAYNEAENIAHLLPTIPTRVDNYPVVVLLVNDGSSDDTAGLAARHGAFVVSNPVNRGQGAALRLGYDVVAKLNLDGVAVSMDGDGQHQAKDIPALISPILNDQADFVIGSRCLGDRERDSAVRFFGIHIYNLIIRILTGYKITDCSSGFRAFNLKMLRNLQLKQNQFVAPEIIIDAAKKQYRIVECPITITKRFKGISKKGANWHYGFNFFRSIVRSWLR
jgi:hypothetical protein